MKKFWFCIAVATNIAKYRENGKKQRDHSLKSFSGIDIVLLVL